MVNIGLGLANTLNPTKRLAAGQEPTAARRPEGLGFAGRAATTPPPVGIFAQAQDAAPQDRPFTETELSQARSEAEERFPFLKNFQDLDFKNTHVPQKGGRGEFLAAEEGGPPGQPNPFVGRDTIVVGQFSRGRGSGGVGLQGGGLADSFIGDSVHFAAIRSPEFQSLLKEMVENFSESEIRLARRRYGEILNQNPRLQQSPNFATFENFLSGFWAEGTVQHLLIPFGSEIDRIKGRNPSALKTFDKIETLFKSER